MPLHTPGHRILARFATLSRLTWLSALLDMAIPPYFAFRTQTGKKLTTSCPHPYSEDSMTKSTCYTLRRIGDAWIVARVPNAGPSQAPNRDEHTALTLEAALYLVRNLACADNGWLPE